MENRNLDTVIFRRSDLLENKDKKIKDISIIDFKKVCCVYSKDLYIFVDDDYKTIILKSRYTGNIADSDSLYCIEVGRGGIGEEDLVVHLRFRKEPKRSEVVKEIIDLDIGYDDNYCKLNYYKI